MEKFQKCALHCWVAVGDPAILLFPHRVAMPDFGRNTANDATARREAIEVSIGNFAEDLK